MKTINSLNSFIDFLYNTLTEDDISYIKENTKSPQDMALFHTGYGRYIRNNYGLWEQSHLYKLIQNETNLFHPDDMSGIILKCLWCKINNQNYDVPKWTESCFNHWKNYGITKDNWNVKT